MLPLFHQEFITNQFPTHHIYTDWSKQEMFAQPELGRIFPSSQMRLHVSDLSPEEFVKCIKLGSLVTVKGNINVKEGMSEYTQLLGDLLQRTSGKALVTDQGLTVISAHPDFILIPGERPQNTPKIQTPHTDGAFEEKPPLIVALGSESSAWKGGENMACTVQSVLRMLLNQFKYKELTPLFEPDSYTLTRRDKSMSRALFELDVYPDQEMYIRSYFSVYDQVDHYCSPKASIPFNSIKKYVYNPKNSLIFNQEPGDITFYPNDTIYHGRLDWNDKKNINNSYTQGDYDGVRILYRAWYSGSALLDQGYRSGVSLTTQKEIAFGTYLCESGFANYI